MEHRYPESPVFYRRLDRAFPLAVRAEGCWIEDETGKRYLDAVGGAFVVNSGHGVAEIAAAMGEQAARLAYVNGTQFTHAAAEELAAELAEILPAPLHFSYFLGSGSEAVEAAVKLARQVQVERGRITKWKVVSRVPSYHGNTLAALALSGREHYRKTYGPLMIDFPRFPAPDPYRHPDSAASTGEALAQVIAREDAETIAAVVIEPIGGSSTGAVVPSDEYHRRIAELCRQHDILLIADEVLTGAGRTGRWFAFQHYDGFVPDIVVLGNGINGVYAPLSAVAATRAVVETVARGAGAFNHAQTYSHSPLICSAAVANLRHLKRHRLVERCAEMSSPFFAALSRLAAHPAVGDVRGKGLLAGVELVADRASKRPFPRRERVAERVTERAFAEGLLVWPNVGHVDGTDGDILMLAPPFTVTAGEIDEIAGRLGRALAAI
jgi:adenosylmethionine-8-amino-7-oxononanoate aminotransferase